MHAPCICCKTCNQFWTVWKWRFPWREPLGGHIPLCSVVWYNILINEICHVIIGVSPKVTIEKMVLSLKVACMEWSVSRSWLQPVAFYNKKHNRGRADYPCNEWIRMRKGFKVTVLYIALWFVFFRKSRKTDGMEYFSCSFLQQAACETEHMPCQISAKWPSLP